MIEYQYKAGDEAIVTMTRESDPSYRVKILRRWIDGRSAAYEIERVSGARPTDWTIIWEEFLEPIPALEQLAETAE